MARGFQGTKDPLVGALIQGRYEILQKVGDGGMGTVYRARQIGVERDVAVKVLKPELASLEDVQQRFETEAHIISQLRHPNVLKLIDFGMDDGRLFLVTEFLRGRSLDAIIRRGPVDELEAIDVLLPIAGALVEAHGRGIVHRDLKPANIFLETVADNEHVKILDFGIAKLVEQPGLTSFGAPIGTPSHMSPEQAKGEVVDGRSDIYSLGVMAYECVTGRPPFSSASVAGLMLKHINDAPTPPSKLEQAVPLHVDLEALVMRCLAKDPEARPQSAAHLRDELEKIREWIKTARHGTSIGLPTLAAADQTFVPGEAEEGTTHIVRARPSPVVPSRPIEVIEQVPPTVPAAEPSKSPLLIVGSALLLGAGVIFSWAWNRGAQPDVGAVEPPALKSELPVPAESDAGPGAPPTDARPPPARKKRAQSLDPDFQVFEPSPP